MNNPLLNKNHFFIYVSIWLIISLFSYLFLKEALSVSWQIALLDTIIFNIIYFGFGLGFWYSAQFISLEKNRLSQIIIKHLVAAVAASVLWNFSGSALVYLVGPDFNEYHVVLRKILPLRLIMGVFLYCSMIFFYYLLIYYFNFQSKVLKETELSLLHQDAELKALKYQINPHFIFNSLNSISSLTLDNPEKAREMIIKLSSFMRSTIVNSELQKTPLSEELKNIQLYLDIEKIRFEDKFHYVRNINPCCLNMLVPHMILQPIFENAIKYGVYESLETVIISLTCTCEENYLKMIVENNYDVENPVSKGKQVGLQNIKKRLNLIYNQDNLLVTEKKDNFFRAIIYIPI